MKFSVTVSDLSLEEALSFLKKDDVVVEGEKKVGRKKKEAVAPDPAMADPAMAAPAMAAPAMAAPAMAAPAPAMAAPAPAMDMTMLITRIQSAVASGKMSVADIGNLVMSINRKHGTQLGSITDVAGNDTLLFAAFTELQAMGL